MNSCRPKELNPRLEVLSDKECYCRASIPFHPLENSATQKTKNQSFRNTKMIQIYNSRNKKINSIFFKPTNIDNFCNAKFNSIILFQTNKITNFQNLKLHSIILFFKQMKSAISNTNLNFCFRQSRSTISNTKLNSFFPKTKNLFS